MDVEKLIQAAERVISGDTIKRSVRNGKLAREKAELILAMRDGYEALIKAERAKVVQEVMEWAEKVAEGMISSNLTSDWDNGFHRCYGMLKSKLFDMSIYSMEDKTNV